MNFVMLNVIICPSFFSTSNEKRYENSSFYRAMKFGHDYATHSRIIVVSRWRYYGKLTALGIKFVRVNNFAVPKIFISRLAKLELVECN